jgi:bifunctional DNA-binding transcriptional regulator/antitoxin component of YhaV-PrlF toxin-antitoxin module
MSEQSWVLPVDEDGVITFPADLIDKMGWSEGTVLEWDIREDGSINLKAATDEVPQETSEKCRTSQPSES